MISMAKGVISLYAAVTHRFIQFWPFFWSGRLEREKKENLCHRSAHKHVLVEIANRFCKHDFFVTTIDARYKFYLASERERESTTLSLITTCNAEQQQRRFLPLVAEQFFFFFLNLKSLIGFIYGISVAQPFYKNRIHIHAGICWWAQMWSHAGGPNAQIIKDIPSHMGSWFFILIYNLPGSSVFSNHLPWSWSS